MKMRWMIALALLAASCIWTSAAIAGAPPVPIEGTLLASGWGPEIGPYAYFMEGSSDNTRDALLLFFMGDVSPLEDQVAYAEDVLLGWPPTHIWKAHIDGSNQVNLTGLEGANLGGINCWPKWSPDASHIAFMHCDPVEGLLPCEVGFEVWVMNADGIDAHRVTPEGVGNTHLTDWSPNGYRLLCDMWGAGICTIDIDGTDLEFLPSVGAEGDWSPDGSKIIGCDMFWDVVGGEPGVWRVLLLTNADGSNPQVLVAHFVKESDALDHMARLGIEFPGPWENSLGWNVGPTWAQFSPLGDRVAFIAAGLGVTYPFFDPQGPHYSYQNEIWVYELATGDLTRITDDLDYDTFLSWKGHNTFPEEPEVTVGNVTVTFSEVTGEGVTTIMRDDDPPYVPTGFEFDYDFYELNTTAEVTGPVSICMTYTDEEVPPGPAEADLFILHYDEVAQLWEDITTSHDTANNIICGETDSLSPVALQGIRRTQFPDVPAWGFGAEGLDPHWAYYDVMACVAAQIVGGYPDGTYRPTGVVARDQMAVFISRSLAGGDEGVPEFEGTPTFPDVPTTHWAVDYVEYAVASEVVGGYEDGTYGPSREVNRGQMAVFVARAMAGGDGNVPEYTGSPTFPDVASDFWAFRYVEYIREAGVTQGFGDGLYHPEYSVTRDQMAVYVSRAFGLTG
jgi:hypothetical protein